MSFLAVTGLVNGITCVSLALFVILKNWKGLLNRSYFVLNSSVALYSFGYFFWQIAPTYSSAFEWFRILTLGIILINQSYLYFVFAFVNILAKRKVLLQACFLTNLAFIGFNFSSLLYSGLVPKYGFGYWPVPRPLFHFYLAFWTWQCLYGFSWLLHGYRTSTGVKKEQVKYFLLSAVFGFSGGATNWPLWYSISFPPYLNILISVYVGIVAYAVVRYRLLDINVVVTRTTVFTVVYVLLLGLPLIGALTWQTQLERLLGARWWVWLWIICALLATAAHYVNLYFQRKAEAVLLRKQRRYHETLLQASQGMTQIRELKQLLNLIVHVITKTVGLSHAAIFLEETTQDAATFVLTACRYRKLVGPCDRLLKTDALIECLMEERQPLVLEELQAELGEMASQNGHSDRRVQALAQLKDLNASVVVPSFIQNRLIGLLMLGQKRRNEVFTTEDLIIFSTLANQAALAIENARFFEELKTNEAYLIQSEKMASLGQLASGMAHEIHNPLTIISGEAQLHLERFKDQDQRVDQLLHSIIEECHRAADITRRILRFAKPSSTDFGPVDLRTVVEDSLQLASYQVRLHQVERQLELPADLPKVRGIQTQLQEVILNLIVNACQAMGEQGGTLTVSAAAGSEQVELRVSDTGAGIPHSKLTKIFDPFYTTKHSGTGLGLFVSQRIIRAHHGSIDVRSTEGRGTTFTVRLPVFHERAAQSPNGATAARP